MFITCNCLQANGRGELMKLERLRLNASEDKQSQSLSLIAYVSQMACLETPLTKRSQGVLSKEGVFIGITICQSTTRNGEVG